MPAAPRKRLNRISEKQRAKRGGGKVYSTFTPPTERPASKPRKPMRAVNPEAAAKRKAARKRKHAKYRRSETYKLVAARAGGQCEFQVLYRAIGVAELVRCPETEGLEHHHKRYGKQFGGNERPEDMLVLCKQHHAFYESQHPTRKR